MTPANGAAATLIVAALFLAGCATKHPATATNSSQGASGAGTSANPSFTPGSQRDFQATAGDRVFFAYNSVGLDDPAKAILRKQAAWLATYKSVTLLIEGNCDERGTREYNLALGARRAQAVADYLAALGISPQRLETVSYGKERPVCADSIESCWRQNRSGVSAIKGGAAS